MSYHDHIADFISFMESNGVEPAESIASQLASGSLIRFQCKGDGRGRRNGWAILYLDEHPAGAFGNYRQNTGTLKWKASAEGPALSQEEREALQREWRENKARREDQREEAAREAALDAGDIWQRAERASIDHPYCKRKKLRATFIKQDGGKLLIPMFDEHGMLWNIQRIAADGEKRFLRGGRTSGLFFLIGVVDDQTDDLIICEGYATGEAIYQATGHPVVVAFNSTNMVAVARVWANARPDLTFTVFADDDAATCEKTGRNVGHEAAQAAANEIGARLASPLGRAA